MRQNLTIVSLRNVSVISLITVQKAVSSELHGLLNCDKVLSTIAEVEDVDMINMRLWYKA